MQGPANSASERAAPLPAEEAAAPRPGALARGSLALAMLGSGASLVALAWWFGLRPETDDGQGFFALWGLSLAVLGRFVIFTGSVEGAALTPWELGLMVWLTDLFIALVIAGGAPWLERVPVFGRWMLRARRRAAVLLAKYPRLAGMAFGGVVLLVLLPIAATGAVTGAFAARLLGLAQLVGVTAVAVGSALGVTTFALLAQIAGERAGDVLHSPVLAAVSIVCLIVFGRIVYLYVVRHLEQDPR